MHMGQLWVQVGKKSCFPWPDCGATIAQVVANWLADGARMVARWCQIAVPEQDAIASCSGTSFGSLLGTSWAPSGHSLDTIRLEISNKSAHFKVLDSSGAQMCPRWCHIGPNWYKNGAPEQDAIASCSGTAFWHDLASIWAPSASHLAQYRSYAALAMISNPAPPPSALPPNSNLLVSLASPFACCARVGARVYCSRRTLPRPRVAPSLPPPSLRPPPSRPRPPPQPHIARPPLPRLPLPPSSPQSSISGPRSTFLDLLAKTAGWPCLPLMADAEAALCTRAAAWIVKYNLYKDQPNPILRGDAVVVDPKNRDGKFASGLAPAIGGQPRPDLARCPATPT